MSYSRGEIYAFQEASNGLLEINFIENLSLEHNRKSRCGGHWLNKDQVETLLYVCQEYLKDLEEQNARNNN